MAFGANKKVCNVLLVSSLSCVAAAHQQYITNFLVSTGNVPVGNFLPAYFCPLLRGQLEVPCLSLANVVTLRSSTKWRSKGGPMLALFFVAILDLNDGIRR